MSQKEKKKKKISRKSRKRGEREQEPTGGLDNVGTEVLKDLDHCDLAALSHRLQFAKNKTI